MDISAGRINGSISHTAGSIQLIGTGLVLRIAMTSADLGYVGLTDRSISLCGTGSDLCARLIYASWPTPIAGSKMGSQERLDGSQRGGLVVSADCVKATVECGRRRVRAARCSAAAAAAPGSPTLVWALHFRECSRELAVGPAAQDGGHAVTAGGPARYRMKQPSGQDTWRLRGRTRGHRRAPSRARPGRQRELDRPGQRFPSDPAVGLD
jgi:hypothetical protein